MFSNRRPLQQLAHRDVIEINTRDDETEEQRLAHHNVVKTKHKITGEAVYKLTITKQGQMDERKIYTYDSLPKQIKIDVYDDEITTDYQTEDELE